MQGYLFESVNSEKVNFLIIYDISDDKRRRKLAIFLEGYGKRVQESAFEFCVSKRIRRDIIDKIPSLIKDDDSVRVYPIEFTNKVISWGECVDFIKSDVLIA